MKNYYEILGVATSAEQEVIVAAYKALAKLYHPDLNSSNDAQQRMAEINEAYQVLSDPNRREKYDQKFNSSTSFSSDDESEAEGLADVLADDWEILISVFEDAEFYREELFKLDPRLSVFYQLTLLTKKLGNKSKETFDVLSNAYLEEHFSSYKPLQEIAVEALLLGEEGFVDSIRKKVSLLGDDVAKDIFSKAKEDFAILKTKTEEEKIKRKEALKQQKQNEIKAKKEKEDREKAAKKEADWQRVLPIVSTLQDCARSLEQYYSSDIIKAHPYCEPLVKVETRVEKENNQVSFDFFQKGWGLISKNQLIITLTLRVNLITKTIIVDFKASKNKYKSNKLIKLPETESEIVTTFENLLNDLVLKRN